MGKNEKVAVYKSNIVVWTSYRNDFILIEAKSGN